MNSTNITENALTLLMTNKSVEKRAEAYVESIRRNLQKSILDTLIEKKEKLEDEIIELQDMSVSTDMNAGEYRISKEQAQTRFERIIEIDFELTLLNQELKVKQEAFNKLFEGVPVTEGDTN